MNALAYGWMVLGGVAAAADPLADLHAHRGGPFVVGGRTRLKVPLLGPAQLKAETARFARAMATLLENSVPLVQSIGISAATLNKPG